MEQLTPEQIEILEILELIDDVALFACGITLGILIEIGRKFINTLRERTLKCE